MNRLTLTAVLFAAFTGVTASAQILTNYGDATYTDGRYVGSWDGSTGRGISAYPWAAQTFIAPTSGSTTLYAYNFQVNVASGSTASFTTAIYAWSGNTIGGQITSDVGTGVLTNYDFEPVGVNTVSNPGFGVTLNAGQLYALVIHRTDGGGGTVQLGEDTTEASNLDDPLNPIPGAYMDGKAFRSTIGTTGTTFSQLNSGNSDFAFWVSFDSNTLSPDQLIAVPEPAVNGAIIGVLFVAGLAVWRRQSKKKATGVSLSAA